MKNWNTNISKFKSLKQKHVWELSQLINYGLDGTRLDEDKVKKYWKELKPLLDAQRARMLEYLLWKRLYSLPANENFWKLSPKTNS